MASFDWFVEQLALVKSWPPWIAFMPITLTWLYLRLVAQPTYDEKTPPSIPESIPGLSNAYRYVFHNMDFLHHVKKKFAGQHILRFKMGHKGFYLINGAKNANSVVRSSGHLSSDALIYMAMIQLDGVSAKDIQKYKMDKSSRTHTGDANIPDTERYWAPLHRLMTDHLASKTAVTTLQSKFCEDFSATLDKQPKSEWRAVQLYKFLQVEMAKSATIAFAGTEILKQNPGIVEAMWRFDDTAYPLALSVPRLLYGKPYATRDRFHMMCEAWLRYATEKYNWDGPDHDWDPLFGTRYFRLHAKYLQERDFEMRSQLGMLLTSVWALNANSIPMTCWLIIHVLEDKTLLQTVREAAMTAYVTDPVSGTRKIDGNKLSEIPLFQSIYTETLRIHVSINITREVTDDMTLDGYTLKKGYLVQTPSRIAHFDESIWSDRDHPPTEFWAERHIKYVEEGTATGERSMVPVFSTEGRSGGFFPYGGGSSMCPGRHFAKQEILTAMALLVTKFDIELVEYVNKDGSKSNRGPKDDPWYCGTATMPPDRDLKIRWKRL